MSTYIDYYKPTHTLMEEAEERARDGEVAFPETFLDLVRELPNHLPAAARSSVPGRRAGPAPCSRIRVRLQ